VGVEAIVDLISQLGGCQSACSKFDRGRFPCVEIVQQNSIREIPISSSLTLYYDEFALDSGPCGSPCCSSDYGGVFEGAGVGDGSLVLGYVDGDDASEEVILKAKGRVRVQNKTTRFRSASLKSRVEGVRALRSLKAAYAHLQSAEASWTANGTNHADRSLLRSDNKCL
jgi:hypothetical protein